MRKKVLAAAVVFLFVSIAAALAIGYSYSFGTESVYGEALVVRVGRIDELITYGKDGRRECDGIGIRHVPFGQIFSTCGKKWLVTSWLDVIVLEDDGGISGRITDAIRKENQEPVLLDRKADHLPEGFDAAQGGPVYRLGDLLLGFVLQKNMNTPLLDLPADTHTDWGGVLVSGDDGAHWQSFLMYLNPKTDDGLVVRHNPVGLFVERGQLFVDVADAAGAGSGEGQLTRYVLSNDHKEWLVEGCYYLVPEIYSQENGFNALQPSMHCLPLQLEG